MMMTPRAKSKERVALGGRHEHITAAHEDHAELIQVARIRTDGGTQMRAELNQEAIEDYADRYANDKPLPPLEVVRDVDNNIWLWNGFHRLAAWRMAHEREGVEVPPIRCTVTVGDRRDAVLKAAGANDENGVRRTNADKRRAVELLLQDDEWRQKTDAWIADQCHVSARTVGNVRRDLVGTRKISESTTRIAADGRVINTANIGTNQPKRKPTPTEIRAQQEPHEPQPQPQPEPPATKLQEPEPQPVHPAILLPEPPSLVEQARRKTVELEQDCEWFEMTLDRLPDWVGRTGRADIAGDIRSSLRAALDVSRKQLAAHRGESWEGDV